MEIKPPGNPAETSSAITRNPAAPPTNSSSNIGDEIVPFVAPNIFSDSDQSAVAAAKIQAAANRLDALRQLSTALRDPQLSAKAQDLIETARNGLPSQGVSSFTPADAELLSRVVDQKANELKDLIRQRSVDVNAFSPVMADIFAAIAIVVAVFTAGAGDLQQLLAQELENVGVEADADLLSDIADAIETAGNDPSIDLAAAFRNIAESQNRVQRVLTEIGDAVLSNRADDASLTRAAKLQQFAEALEGFMKEVSGGDDRDSLKDQLAQIKETVVALRDAIQRQEEMLRKMEELLPQILDAVGDAAGECLKNVPSELQGQQLDLVAELLSKTKKVVESSDVQPIPVSEVNDIKALLTELMHANSGRNLP